MTGYVEGERYNGRQRVGRFVIVAAKLAVTGLCFWYLARNIDFVGVVRAASTLDFRWAGLAVVVVMLQIPLVGLRWHKIVDALGRDRQPIPPGPMVAITWISCFLGQVVPNIAADTLRA